jgi:hypothetical protein
VIKKVATFGAALVAAGMSVSSVSVASSVVAAPLCYSADADTAVTNPLVVAPICEPYPDATLCQNDGTGFGTYYTVHVYFCVPAPVAAPTPTSL